MKRLVVGILLVVFAPKPCSLAVAQDVELPSDASFRQADPLEPVVLLSATLQEQANHVPSDDSNQRAFSMFFPVSDPADPALDEQRFAAQPFADSPRGEIDGYCCPTSVNACPCVYFQVEALFMQRDSRFTSQPIVVDAITGETLLSTSDLDFGYDPGWRVTAGASICGGPMLEFSSFGLCQGSASAVVVAPDDDAFLTLPGNLFGNVFVDMDRVAVNYSSSLNSFELNLPCCCGCREVCCDECGRPQARSQSFTWIAGFRYLNIDEELNILAQRTVGGELEEGSYNIRTDNQLYGVQLGGSFRKTRGRFGWEATGKAGVFDNVAQQEQTVTDFPDFEIRPTVSSSGGGFAYLGEANLSALYLLTDVWNLRAGYSVLWIDGLALAPDQLDFNFASSSSGNQLHTGGAIFLHGANLGLEARW